MSIRSIVLAVAIMLLTAGSALAQDAGPLKSQALLDTIAADKGKVVVVNFFASWCKPCLMELPGFIEARREFDKDKVVFIGVSLDQDEAAYHRLVKETGFNFPVHLAESDILSTFGVKMIPKTLVYDKTGQQALDHDGYMPGEMLRQVVKSLLTDGAR